MTQLHKKFFITIFLCLVLVLIFFSGVKKMKMVDLAPEQLLASIPEENIFFYYDTIVESIPEIENYTYQGAYLQIDSKLLHFDWEYKTDMNWKPELNLINNGKHLSICFNNSDGVGLHFSSVHIIDLATLKEIPIELLTENLEKHWTIHEFNPNTGFIQFEGFEKKVSLNVDPGVFNIHIFPTINYSSVFLYEIVNDTLICTSSLQISPSYFIGDLEITYQFKNNRYEMVSMDFTPSYGTDPQDVHIE